MWTRKKALIGIVIGIILGGFVLGSFAFAQQNDGPLDDEPSRGHMTLDEVPEDAFLPRQGGDGTVQSFAGFLDNIANEQVTITRPRPRPPDLRSLAGFAENIVHGRITNMALKDEDLAVGQLRGASIDLVVTIADPTYIKGAESRPSVWVMNLWSGDPLLADLVMERYSAELGSGPIGAEVLLFSSAAAAEAGQSPGIYDGLVSDGSATSRLALLAVADGYQLTNIATALDELRALGV